MISLSRLVIAAAYVGAAAALPAQSDRVAIDYTPTCRQCTVALTRW